MRYFYPVLFLFFCFHCAQAGTASAPVNDDPCNATFIGTLNAASSCPFSSIATPTVVANQSNVGATSEFPQPSLMNCLGSGNMPAQMSDVWYKFIPVESKVDVYVIGVGNTPLQNPVIALYQYNGDCMAMIPVNCAKGSSGLVNATFAPLVPGAEYYLEIGGGSQTDVGQFSIILGNSVNCLSCSQEGMLFVNPAPVNGYFNSGEQVNFCYVLNGYKRYNNNSLHGVVPVFGTGWDMTSIIFTLPVQRTTTTPGNWIVYTYANLPVVGTQKGFFFDDPSNDGNPANNLGDAGGDYDTWNFCWSIKANQCPTALKDLNVAVHLFSDGRTGTGPQPGCLADQPYHFSATLNCCGGASASLSPETCTDSCDASIAFGFNPSASFLPLYNFNWYDDSGTNIQSTTGQTNTIDNISGLCTGSYTAIVSSTASPGCFISQNFQVDPAFHIQNTFQTFFPCVNSGGLASVSVVVVPSSNTYTYSWSNGQTTPSATGLQTGVPYVVAVTNQAGTCTQYDTIIPVSQPLQDPTFQYPSSQLARCQTGPQFVSPLYIATPGGQFSCAVPNIVDAVTGAITMANTTVSSTYTIVYTTPGPCPSMDSVTITITGQDPAYFSYPNTTICSTDLNPLIPDSVLAYGGYFSVSPSTGFSVDSLSGVASPVYAPGTYVVTYNSPSTGPCHSTYSVTVLVQPPPNPPVPTQSVYYYCIGDSVTMTATPPSNCPTCYVIWTDNPFYNPPYYTTNTLTVDPSVSTVYYLVAYNLITGCISNTISVSLAGLTPPIPVVTSSDSVVCPGFTGQLHSGYSGSGYTFSWDPSTGLNDPTVSDPQFTINSTTTYTVYVTENSTGCSGACQTTVVVDSTLHCDSLIIYSGFSPDGDNHNDSWIIDGITRFPKNHVSIFNRWGEKVWQASDYNNLDVVWKGENLQGQKLPSGTYYFVIEVPDKRGRTGWVELTK